MWTSGGGGGGRELVKLCNCVCISKGVDRGGELGGLKVFEIHSIILTEEQFCLCMCAS